MQEQLVGCVNLIDYQVWYGKWTETVRKMIRILISGSIVEFGINCSEAVLTISSAFENSDLPMNLPAYRIAIRVRTFYVML